jgi:hypothetical protein
MTHLTQALTLEDLTKMDRESHHKGLKVNEWVLLILQ